MVKNISRRAARNPKVFVRQVKQDMFAPVFYPSLPLPSHGEAELVGGRNPWGPTGVEELFTKEENETAQHEELSYECIRKLAIVPRRKAAGPNGVPPYALYVLP